jgi:hypothetical protein
MERDRQDRTRTGRRHGESGGAGRSRVKRNRLLALAILAILGLAALAPVGQASEQGQHELVQAQHLAERAARLAQREARRNARNEAKAHNRAVRQVKAEEHAARLAEPHDVPNAVVTITCTSITVEFHEFTSLPGSKQTISQKVIYRQAPRPFINYVFAPPNAVFEGEGTTEEIPIAAPLGESTVGIRAHWNNDGLHGGFNVHQPLTCGPNSQFSLETVQSLGGSFTKSTLPGVVGETVDYQTVATNTGNTPLTFGELSSPGCDGMPAGGSGEAIAPRATMTWFCHHTLTAADQKAGPFANAASVTAVPQSDPFNPSITHTSQGVLISPIVAEVSTASKPVGTTSSGTPKSGVAGFKVTATPIPALLGPSKCVRGMFSASVKSTGVASVMFYIDGHKLARRTAHSAVKGLIAVRINGAKLKKGVHRLLAKISMSSAASGSRTRTVRRCAPPAHKH